VQGAIQITRLLIEGNWKTRAAFVQVLGKHPITQTIFFGSVSENGMAATTARAAIKSLLKSVPMNACLREIHKLPKPSMLRAIVGKYNRWFAIRELHGEAHDPDFQTNTAWLLLAMGVPDRRRLDDGTIVTTFDGPGLSLPLQARLRRLRVITLLLRRSSIARPPKVTWLPVELWKLCFQTYLLAT
jgi:hypothetical protein